MKGIDKSTLQKRISYGWGLHEAVEVPVTKKRKVRR